MAFSEFTQQQRVVELLQRSLERGRLGHAYLFTGGKLEELSEMAKTLAKTLNCEQPVKPDGNPTGLPVDCCDRCNSCRKINGEIHPDIQWVRPESKMRIIRIDQMRNLMQTIFLKPSEGRYKVAILVAADRMKDEAANAFLKTLEEPPKQTVFILLSSDHQRLLETILSRCLRLHFAGESGPGVSPDVVEWLRGFSSAVAEQGAILARYRLLGLLLERLKSMKEQIAEELAAKSPMQRYEEAEASLRDKWEDELNAAVEAEYRRQRTDVLLALQWWFRDIWMLSLYNQPSTSDEAAAGCGFPELLHYSQSVAGRVKPQDLAQNLVTLEQTQTLLHTNVQEALALEVGFLKLKL